MKYDQLSQTELWGMIAVGDRKSFGYIFMIYSDEMYKYGHRVTSETALIEDGIQDVFVHLWEVRETLFVHSSIKFYLFPDSIESWSSVLRKRSQVMH